MSSARDVCVGLSGAICMCHCCRALLLSVYRVKRGLLINSKVACGGGEARNGSTDFRAVSCNRFSYKIFM